MKKITLNMKSFLRGTVALAVMCLSGSLAYADGIDDLEKDADGYYKLTSLEDWNKFADAVNAGNTKLNARMYADIGTVKGYNEGENHTIAQYCGHFDGQGHKLDLDIRYMNQDLGAPFNSLGTPDNSADNPGGVVENLWTTGNIYTNMKNVGGIAGAMYWASIKNCISTVKIVAEKQPGDLDKVGGSPWNGGYWDGTEGGLVGKAFTAGCKFINSEWAGSQDAPQAHSTCGICAYSGDGPQTFDGCISITDWTICSTNNTSGRNVAICREKGNRGNAMNIYHNNWCTLGDNFDGDNRRIFVQGRCNNVITQKEVTSGELCYAINGDQSDIQYYQNIEGDDINPYPVPFSSGGKHKRVYIIGEVGCDGKPIGQAVYTNEPQEDTKPAHQYTDGVCNVCGACQKDYMQPQDGWFTANSSNEMKWIIDYYNRSSQKYNIRLNADVDVSGGDYQLNSMTGIFDGQGHTVNIECNGPFFGSPSSSEIIRNATFTGSVTVTSDFYGGLAKVASCRFENINNLITFNANVDWTTNAACGAFVGTDEAGLSFKNCIFGGKLTGTTGNCGAFVGWSNNHETYENCAYIGEIELPHGGSSKFNRGYWGTYTHCFVKGESEGYGESVTEEQIQSGMLTWKMNYENFKNPLYYQTIGVDKAPTLDSTHGVVYMKADGTLASVQDEASYAEFAENYIKTEKARVDALATSATMAEAYMNKLAEIFESTSSIQEFLGYNAELQKMNNDMNTAIEQYAIFKDLVAQYKAELAASELQSENRAALAEYLSSEDEADETLEGEVWRFGGAQYVIANRTADLEGIKECIEYIRTLWSKIGVEQVVKDADITNIMFNPNFDTKSGWTGNYNVSDGMGIMTTGKISQTLKELKNGVYELQMSGMFLPCGYDDSRFYTAYLYAGDQIVPIMVSDEEESNAMEAEDVAAAFAEGKYINTILVNVTDGTLELGVRNDGTVSGGDKLFIDNAKLTYRGELAEAGDAIANTLAGQSARAAALIASKAGDGEDHRMYPGFTQVLKDQLQAKIDAVAGAQDPYALVGEFSSLFTKVQQCQRNYISMYSFMSTFAERYDCELIFYLNDLQKAETEKVLTAIGEGFVNGTISEEDAINNTAIKGLSFYSEIYGQEPEMVSGVYQIANGNNLLWYALAVNNGNTSAKAELTDDIDMSVVISCPVIASGKTFYGSFDGKGHTIKNFNMVLLGNNTGLFGSVGKGSVVRNFCIEGTMNIKDGTKSVGVVGYYVDGELSNIHSAMNMVVEGSATKVGGIVGTTDNSKGDYTTTISNCTFSGSINTGNSENGCFGGIVGDAGYPAFANCGNYGNITTNSGSNIVGGIVGTTHETSWRGFRYCINVGNIVCTAAGDNKCAAFVGEVGWYSGGSVYNNYYLDTTCAVASNGNQFPADLNKAYSAEAFANGEVVNLLNMKQSSPAWKQGELYPTLYSIGVQETVALITNVAQLSSNASDRDEGKDLGALIDGNADSFWHTDWHNDCHDQYHYLQVALNYEYTGDITMKMTRRKTANDHPTKMIVWASQDGVEYTELTTLDLPYNGEGTEESAVFTVANAKYLRFAAADCTGSGGYGFRTFWHTAEFQLYGTIVDGVENVSVQNTWNNTDAIYNLSGLRLNKLQRGINIVNGKKIFVK